MKWTEIRLGEVIDVKHGFAFKGEQFSDAGEHVLLSPGNCYESGGLRLKGDKEKYYSGDFPEEFLLHRGDMLLVMTDLVNDAPILGGSFIIPEDNRFLHNQRLGLVEITDPHRIDKHFLYYLLNTRTYRAQVRGSASGATVRHTSPGRIKACRVRIPEDVEAQAEIGSTLAAYDDLIANNLRRMALLEDAARMLYREWFIRLRFPGYEHTHFTKGVPDGWSTLTLEAACDGIEDGDWIESKDQGGEDYRLLQVSNIGVNEFVETGNFRYITADTFRRLNCRDVVPGQILVSRMPTPIGRAWLVTKMPWKMITAVDVAILRPKQGVTDEYFLVYHLNSSANIDLCERRSAGATRPRIARRELAALPVVVPPMALQRQFRDVVEPINQQRANLHRQNDKLRAARDLLLPRLMTGEISV